MFTNWLTGPPSSGISGLSTGVIATPPDVVLEVGPAPSTRFVAHSVLLAMHSGYLRSAIRMDENGVPCSDLPIFLTNVTPEQFAPLLTYMYTGYLDLNIENIFGVLLATHVLHMPRPLEICRAFLSRTQSEGYLTGSFLSQLGDNNSSSNTSGKASSSTNNGVKVIRPIASKPAIPNLGFIVPPMPHISLPSTGTPFRSLNNHKDIPSKCVNRIVEHKTDDVSLLENKPNTSKIIPVINTNKETVSLKKSPKLSKRSSCTERPKRVPCETANSNIKKESPDNENKIIIDVASCDGPVRFRRVLNDAYGRQPQISDVMHLPSQERSHQSVSHSFHQQMAKNISQRQLQVEESENSEDLKQSQLQNQGNGSGEIYNCVYCKHTFKSQYCYQKHAKRHLNPLSLEGGGGGDISSVVSNPGSDSDNKEEKTLNRSSDIKREVRPLDMNVQYYPCKTCGSKFPSYYFVHKHRKMCHANEESAQ